MNPYHDWYVTSTADNTVYVIKWTGPHGTVVTTVNVGARDGTYGIAYDPDNHYMYVTEGEGDV